MSLRDNSELSKLENSVEVANKFGTMERGECLYEWRRRFKRPPPKYLSLAFLRKALAFEAQVAAHGGHSKRVRKVFRLSARQSLSKVDNKCSPRKAKASSLKAGTQLVREWNGRTHIVEVFDDGFIMDGKSYRSLTAIAKDITGAHWSGPRFFGLKG